MTIKKKSLPLVPTVFKHTLSVNTPFRH